MRLKHLELLGYKTFAARTEFVFDAGITAVVGPNGSGKSNIADAVRWVLGEQSFSLLRAKRSEDMIFAGSERRPRMGMAEATITLDNSDQWLPIDFDEVAITRRCHRSGENEYLLNGSRVRRRDIADMLAKSGLARRSYTVIGQGLIDAALSLRPQERRALIEEAAGLTLYQSRRADALNRLEETTHNITRVRDLIAEISPRLGRLQRQAERAREHAMLRQELDKALKTWYGYEWKRSQDELARRRAIERYQLRQLETQRAGVREVGEQIAGIRNRQNELRRQLGTWHRESSALHSQSEALQRDLAVLDERRRQLLDRRQEVLSEIMPLEAGREMQERGIASTQDELTALAETLDLEQASVAQAQDALDAQREQSAKLQMDQAAAQSELLACRAKIMDAENRQSQLEEQQTQLDGERRAHHDANHELEARLDSLRADLSAISARLATLTAGLDELDRERKKKEQQIAAAQDQLRDLEKERNELAARLVRTQERYSVLTRTRREGDGLYDGVRSVLQLAQGLQGSGPRLTGILGTVAELIEVPRELETAIEVALASQLQSIVVESWSDAQASIDYLKRERAGRATFLPLDTLRPGQPIRPPRRAGVIGLASDLVRYESRLKPVALHLLGRTIVCQDLSVAQQVLEALKGGYQIVTPEGEQVRSSGAVTGGRSRQRRGTGLLAREREWRELPAQLRALKQQHLELETSIQSGTAHLGTLEQQRAELLQRQARQLASQRELEDEQRGVQQERERLARERNWHASLADQAERRMAELQQQRETLDGKTSEWIAQRASLGRLVAEMAAQIEQYDARELTDLLLARRAQVASTRQQQATKLTELAAYERSRRQINEQIAHRQRQSVELAADLARTEQRIGSLQQDTAALGVEIQGYAKRIQPAETESADLEAQQALREQEEEQARLRLQALEAQHNRVQLQVARQEDHMDTLRQQIEADLGLVDLEMGDELSGQPLLPLGPLVSSLPEVEILPEGLEAQIRSFKRRLRRLEPVNPDAPAEYDQVSQRHAFLSEQAEDLERAIADLREVIAELDEVMEREFRRTYTTVAREFRAYFQQLFGGGSARLQLSEPEDLMTTGIDVVARPPGKRQQGLALLSGGERALTAAALVFAILAASPTPFCVLDEVDAALDEANVGRFRTVLRALAQETQFVIITHNRYTIEIADIVYGVTMSGDGTSCVISHRLNDPRQDTDVA
jgi:chromosome segregation protein